MVNTHCKIGRLAVNLTRIVIIYLYIGYPCLYQLCIDLIKFDSVNTGKIELGTSYKGWTRYLSLPINVLMDYCIYCRYNFHDKRNYSTSAPFDAKWFDMMYHVIKLTFAERKYVEYLILWYLWMVVVFEAWPNLMVKK